jgi:hypothetical protein
VPNQLPGSNAPAGDDLDVDIFCSRASQKLLRGTNQLVYINHFWRKRLASRKVSRRCVPLGTKIAF